jgi:putative ABC transport system permease protein
MNTRDLLRLAWGSVAAHRLRSRLTVLGIVIGIASVILLTSLGEGTRRAILSDFTQFGTNIMAINKGRRRTSGMPGLGATIRKLTIEDAEALRRVRGVEKVLMGAYGSARVEFGERGRDVLVAGVTPEMPEMFRFPVRQGRFLPPGDPRRGTPLAVLGPRVKRELFGESNALGERVRIGGRRFVVIGVMEPKGQFLGLDMDDRVYIPVASAETLFHQDELSEIHILFSGQVPLERIKAGVRRVLMDRHDGEEDFTVTTQTEMLAVLDRILSAVTAAVTGIAAVSLLVGAIGILTMMWISVGERTSEIGLAKAIGAGSGQILRLFLAEAAILSLAGGGLGVAIGMGLGRTIRMLWPAFPFHTQPVFVGLALAVSLAVGLSSGVLPARRAAAMDPLEALRHE